jgi:LysR family transcriptional regulator, transcriptional activator of the cysJI operon
MLGVLMNTFMKVAEKANFTKAGEELGMTQPAVSHQIKQLEDEVGHKLIIRNKNGLILTPEGEIVLKYARRLYALNEKMLLELAGKNKILSLLRVGITHTCESNLTAESLAKVSAAHKGLRITLTSDTINNLYDKLESYELDLAIIDGPLLDNRFSSMMLDTDYLVCVMSPTNPLARNSVISLAELKKEKLILRTAASGTRTLFESTLESNNEAITSFDVILEVDNIATIKDLIRKDLGVSILPRSACLDEIRKGKVVALPIENFSMVRETRIVYNRDFSDKEFLNEIIKVYGEER